MGRPVREAGAPPTAQRILDLAERLAQTRGYNGFSYADVAAELGVTKASLHYHFASKAALGRALMVRYSRRFADALAAVDAGGTAALPRLRRYVRLYRDVLLGHRMCLCGMLAAEVATLPGAVRREVTRFFDRNEAWVSAVLAEGRRRGELGFEGAPRPAARLLVGALEGAMLIARTYGDVSRFESAAQQLLARLGGPARGSRRPKRSGGRG